MNETEFSSLLELLGMLATSPRTAVLFGLLLIAAVTDYRTMKVPNWLTFGGAAFAIAYNTAFPVMPHFGVLWTVGGLGFGLLALLPLYALGAMGAGDVKLMAMVGAFIGVPDVIGAVLASFIAGGVAAILHGVVYGSLGRIFSNIVVMLQRLMGIVIAPVRNGTPVGTPPTEGKLPFGVSIAGGTIVFVVARQLGFV